jgi:hypothetical protein
MAAKKIPIVERVEEPTKRISRRAPVKNDPFIFVVTILDKPDKDGNDVIFNHSGKCPSDIDPDALEEYIADYFGGEDEYEEEDE